MMLFTIRKAWIYPFIFLCLGLTSRVVYSEEKPCIALVTTLADEKKRLLISRRGLFQSFRVHQSVEDRFNEFFADKKDVETRVYHQVGLFQLYQLVTNPRIDAVIIVGHMNSHCIVDPSGCIQVKRALMGAWQRKLFIGLYGCQSAGLAQELREVMPQAEIHGFANNIDYSHHPRAPCVQALCSLLTTWYENTQIVQTLKETDSRPSAGDVPEKKAYSILQILSCGRYSPQRTLMKSNSLSLECCITRTDGDCTDEECDEFLIIDPITKHTLGGLPRLQVGDKEQTCRVQTQIDRKDLIFTKEKRIQLRQGYRLQLHCCCEYLLTRLKDTPKPNLGQIRCQLADNTPLQGYWHTCLSPVCVRFQWRNDEMQDKESHS